MPACGKLCSPDEWNTKGTIAQNVGYFGDGYVAYNKALQWDRRLLDTETVRNFYLNHSTTAKVTSVPLSIVRWTFRMITLPVISAGTILGGVYGYFADKPADVGAAGWALLKCALLASQICIAVFVMSQTTMIVYGSIILGFALLAEIDHGWNVDPKGKFDNAIHFPLEDTMNDTQSGVAHIVTNMILPY